MTPNIIPSIFTATDRLSGPVRRMGLSLHSFAIMSNADLARMQRSFNATSTAAMQLATNSAMVATAILLPLGLATKAAIDFEKEMGNVETLVDTATESMEDMGDEVLKMGKKIPKTLHDLNEALYAIRSDGIKAGNGINEAFGTLESSGKLAVAGLATTTEAAKTVTSAMNVFADATMSSMEIANSMFKTVQNGKTTMSELGMSFGKNAALIHAAGVSLYEYNAATAAITATGITASQAQNEIGASVVALMKPTGNLKSIFRALGYEGEGGFKKLVQASGGLIPALEKVNDVARKLGINVAEAEGRKEALIANILLTGERKASYLENLAIQMNGVNTLNAKFDEQNKKAAQRLQILKTRVQELGISIGNVLIPVFERVSKIISPIIDGVVSFAKENRMLASVVVDATAVVGVMAATVAAVGLAVSIGSKAFVMYKAAVAAYSFVAGFAAVKTGTLTGAILNNTYSVRGAELAYKGFNSTVGKTTVLLVAAYAAYKTLQNEFNRDKKARDHNPMGFDYNKSASDPGNKKIREHYGVSEEQFNKQAANDLRAAQQDGYRPFIGQMLYDRFGHPNTDASKNTNSADSSVIDLQNKINRRDDSVYNKSVSYGGGSDKNSGGKNEIVVRIENNSGLTASVSQNSTNSATKVPIKLISTFSRPKPATS